MRANQVLAMPGYASAPVATRIAVLEVAGGLSYWAGDIAAADKHYFEQVRLARELGEPGVLANVLYNAGFAPLPVYDDRAWSIRSAT